MSTQKNLKRSPIICIAAILACLAFISVGLTSLVYAKYSVKSFGSDYTKVASFKVSASASEDNFTLEDGDTHVYSITISNSGETAARYEAVVEVEGLGTVKTLTGVVEAGQSVVREVEFTADQLAAIPGLSYINNIPFTVLVSFVQID